MHNSFRPLLIALLFFAHSASAQKDSMESKLRRIEAQLQRMPEFNDLTFYYSQMFRNLADSQLQKGVQLNAYADAYLAHYSDRVGPDRYAKFPTSAPVSNSFSLTMLM